MSLAVALLTCDRYEYTARTVESFVRHHPPGTMQFFHADDASADPRIVEYVQSQGFETILRNATRLGCSPTTDALFRAVSARVAPGTPVLYLQNDFETCRTLPTEQVLTLLANPEVAFVQLSYRTPRSRYFRRLDYFWPEGGKWTFGDQAQGAYVWTALGGGLGYHPAVATIATWLSCTDGALKERAFRNKSIRLQKRVARLTLPVFRHIGRHRTPGGMYGARKSGGLSRVGRASYVPAGTFERSPWHAGASLCSYLGGLLKPGMRTLELGSGLSTWLFYAAGCDHLALEHDAKYAAKLPCVHITTLTGRPSWYDWEPNGDPYDVILVDGPPARKRRRFGILRVIDRLVHPATVIVLDDTQSSRGSELTDELSDRLGMTRRDYPASCPRDYKKSFSVLTK